MRDRLTSDIAVRLAELQGWTEIKYQFRGGTLVGKHGGGPQTPIPRPDIVPNDAWGLVRWLKTHDYDVYFEGNHVEIVTPCINDDCRSEQADHDGTEQGIMAALCEAAVKALSEA